MFARVSDLIRLLEHANEESGTDLPIYIFTQGSIGPVPMTPEAMKGGIIAPVGPTTTNGIPMDKHIIIHAPPSNISWAHLKAQHYNCQGITS